MLASLRSLVPKEWDSDHEVAWNWLWEIFGCNREQWETLAVSACIISILHIVTNYFIHFYTWLPVPIARSKGLVWRSFSSVSLCSHDSHVCGIDRQNKKLSIAVLLRMTAVSSSSHPRPPLILLILIVITVRITSASASSWSPEHRNQPHVWSLWRFQYTPAPLIFFFNVLLT